jgi:hypothetical protein
MEKKKEKIPAFAVNLITLNSMSCQCFWISNEISDEPKDSIMYSHTIISVSCIQGA